MGAVFNSVERLVIGVQIERYVVFPFLARGAVLMVVMRLVPLRPFPLAAALIRILVGPRALLLGIPSLHERKRRLAQLYPFLATLHGSVRDHLFPCIRVLRFSRLFGTSAWRLFGVETILLQPRICVRPDALHQLHAHLLRLVLPSGVAQAQRAEKKPAPGPYIYPASFLAGVGRHRSSLANRRFLGSLLAGSVLFRLAQLPLGASLCIRCRVGIVNLLPLGVNLHSSISNGV